MIKRIAAFLIVLSCALVMGAQKADKHASSGAVNKAHLQKIWDGWSTLDPST